MEQYLLWYYCPDTNSQPMQLRAMLNSDFKFTREMKVATHATRYVIFCKYMKHLLGYEDLSDIQIKLLPRPGKIHS